MLIFFVGILVYYGIVSFSLIPHKLFILMNIQTFFLQAGITNAFLIQCVTFLLIRIIRYLNSFFFSLNFRIIADLVNTLTTIVGVQLIDRAGRRRLLMIGALGMCLCELIVAIVGVTAGHINPVTQAVNLPAQKVMIAFVCMCVFFFSFLCYIFSMFIYFYFRSMSVFP